MSRLAMADMPTLASVPSVADANAVNAVNAAPAIGAKPTFTHGPMVPALKLNFDAANIAHLSAVAAPLYSVAMNFVQDASDKTLRWVSLFAFGGAGVAPGALGGKSALDVLVGLGVGVHNSLVSLGVAYELLDVVLTGDAPSSGLLISPHKANLVYTVSVGIPIGALGAE